MSSSSPASGSVIAAAVVCLLGSAFTILGLGISLFGLALAGSRSTPEIPTLVRTAMLTMVLVFLGVAIFGVVTGVALIRLRNWARISALIFAGSSAFFGASTIGFVFLMRIPLEPGAPEVSLGIVRGIALVLYGLPMLVGVWWLILFTRPAIKAQFAGQGIAIDSRTPRKPRCPVPVAVLAWLLVVSGVFSGFAVLLPLHMPVFLFGHVFSGVTGRSIFFLSCLLYVVAGTGLLKLKPWSYPLTIALYLFWLASGTAGLLNPNGRDALNSAMAEMLNSMHLPSPAMQAPDYARQGFAGVFIALAFSAVMLGVLIFYRQRFLEAASAASA
ncbi:MAG: hypothetical protein ABSG16_12985 [Candidatus Acidiferrum sp.]|jgi:hypothetical protein